MATWEAHPPQIRRLLLSTIKADLKSRLLASKLKVDTESTKPLRVNNLREYEEELRQELLTTTSSHKLGISRLADTLTSQSDTTTLLLLDEDNSDEEHTHHDETQSE